MDLLSTDSINKSDLSLSKAGKLFFSFCSRFPAIYASRFTSMNIHQLLPLVDNVRDLGPLFTHSCFHSEDDNSCTLKFLNGTESIDGQIVSVVSFTQKLPEIRTKYILSQSEAGELYHYLLSG